MYMYVNNVMVMHVNILCNICTCPYKALNKLLLHADVPDLLGSLSQALTLI